MHADNSVLANSMATILNSYPPDVAYVPGREYEIPTALETKVIQDMYDALPVSRDAVDRARGAIHTYRDALIIGGFAVRIAITAVREDNPSIFPLSTLCLVLDDSVADWREVIVDLTLVEACAEEIDVDFESAARWAAEFATQERRELIVEGYLRRLPDMRSISGMRYRVCSAGKEFRFEKIRRP